MSMSFPVKGLNAPELVASLRRLRQTDHRTNLIHLATEYAWIAGTLGGTIGWSVYRQSIGWSVGWDLPCFALAYLLIGGLQHRLAGLGHESAHFTLFRNRWANDLAGDLFCFFPLFATLHQYRVTHLAHHQFTNDWEKDPDLTDVGRPKGVHEFPMTRAEFLYRYFVRFLLPWVLPNYMARLALQSVFGKGENPYLTDPKFRRHEPNRHDRSPKVEPVRWLSLAGLVYFFGLAFAMNGLFVAGKWGWLVGLVASAYGGALLVIQLAPASAFFSNPMKSVYSSRFAAGLRLSAMTLLLTTFPLVRGATGIHAGAYFLILWVGPLLTTMAYFMLLRDVYQHANADQGRFTNSRVFFSDRFTRWAVFVYGQDMHVPHHLFPAIPHYHLPEAHRCLKAMSPEYRRHVVECDGLFSNRTGLPTILDVMEAPAAIPLPSQTSQPIPPQRRAS